MQILPSNNIHFNGLNKAEILLRRSRFAKPTNKKIFEKDSTRFFLKEYLFSLNLKTHVSPEEINRLFQLEGSDFFNQSFDYLTKILGIPEKIKPRFIEQQITIKDLYMGYYQAFNFIARKPGLEKEYSKVQLFAAIRHELQHFLQIVNAYRHEELGPKIVEYHADIFLKQTKINLERILKTHFNIDNLRNSGVGKQEIEFLKEIKDAYNKQDFVTYNEKYNKYIEMACESAKIHFENFRQAVIEHYGLIKKGTREANRAEKFYNEFVSNYYNANGELHKGKYFYSVIEFEASHAQDRLERDLTGNNKCFIAEAKENAEMNRARSQKYKEGAADMDDSEKKEISQQLEISSQYSLRELEKFLMD